MLELSNFIHREIISSFAIGMTDSPKRVVVMFTSPILACAIVNLEKIRHDMPITVINNAVDGRPPFVTPLMVDASAVIHQGSSSISLICCKFVERTCLYNISTTNRPSGILSFTHIYLYISYHLALTLSMQHDMVDFAYSSIARSIGISRYTGLLSLAYNKYISHCSTAMLTLL